MIHFQFVDIKINVPIYEITEFQNHWNDHYKIAPYTYREYFYAIPEYDRSCYDRTTGKFKAMFKQTKLKLKQRTLFL